MKFKKDWLVENLKVQPISETLADYSKRVLEYRRIFEFEGKLYETFYEKSTVGIETLKPYSDEFSDEIECAEVAKVSTTLTTYVKLKP